MVGLAVGVHHVLPVGVGSKHARLHRHGVRQFELRELGAESSQVRLDVQRLLARRRLHEDQAVPLGHGHANQFPLSEVDPFESLAPRHALELAVQREAPGMKWAADDGPPDRLGNQLGTAVHAHVEKRLDRAILRANDQNRRARLLEEPGVAGQRNVA